MVEKRKNEDESIIPTSEHVKKLATNESVSEDVVRERIVILLGYSGFGYHGIQINEPLKTIEGDIVHALKDLGYLKKATLDEKHLVIARAARTDKGVHTLGNLVSLNVYVQNSLNPSELREKLNAKLSRQIRVWDVFQVQKYFNPRISCESRTYEYLIPSFSLIPPKDSTPLFKKSQKNFEREPKNQLDSLLLSSTVDTRKFWEQVEIRCKKLQDEFKENPETFTNPFTGFFPEKPIPAHIKVPHEAKLKKALKNADHFYYMNYRVPEERLELLQKVFQLYIGRHNFHNFTITQDPRAPSNYRTIESIECGMPFIYENWEWIPVTIRGNSFMLNQIRKMIAHALMVIRSCASLSVITKALSPEVSMNISKSPGHVLVLKDISFSTYNKSLQDENHVKIDLVKYKEQMENLKKEVIYPDIIQLEQKEKMFFSFLAYADQHTKDQFDYLFQP
ncbi:tRNA pseudouridine synthase Pus2 [Schizosaccharomyces cryophilus OY26]|uniref:tRNA pseudouridine synthase 1 n=1 Tax=Schizosaccharomyces cryophilus (strain OY26 / ATCC MYA-4695 / CBS 11777 / NBRC 106824 / NRRL Y48691) TaxID=653667 RepID=S9VX12_SCHCR|nr:tRNA pseudouridine synthase Pus2 [Schizosaccharomyces cryophilus OY26]EPY50500.1 tRNA pseudouridine synthase Pus2 [Schizosaccharomyces cryophilus OY26]